MDKHFCWPLLDWDFRDAPHVLVGVLLIGVLIRLDQSGLLAFSLEILDSWCSRVVRVGMAGPGSSCAGSSSSRTALFFLLLFIVPDL